MSSTLETFLTQLWSSEVSQARQGCNQNPLEVFGFLAFGLYLLNLAMGMNRRKRSVSEDCDEEYDPVYNQELLNSVMAVTSMFRAFINIYYESEEHTGGACKGVHEHFFFFCRRMPLENSL